MANNLRIIHNNIADFATVTASSTAAAATATTNLKKDAKSLVWRSDTNTTTTTKAALVVDLGATSQPVGGVILAFTNLTSSAVIRVRGYTLTGSVIAGTLDEPFINPNGDTKFDTGYVYAIPPQNLGSLIFGIAGLAPTAYTARRSYARVWIPTQFQVPVSSLSIEITDPYNTDQYVEISRLIVGAYFSPQFNTGYGLETRVNDTSSSERTASGDLYTTSRIFYSSMNFGLEYMSARDRVELNSLLKTVGTRKPLFISLFPDNIADYGKEQSYQLYGKLSTLSGITHPYYEMYSSQIEIEEV